MMYTKSIENSKEKPANDTARWFSIGRILLVDVPFALLFSVLAGSLLIQRIYHNYVVPIAQSYKRGEMIGDFYDNYDNEFTYYNRRCRPADISTRSANDLLIREEFSGQEAADVMLKHGAVAFQNILRNDTASKLREYLAEKHHNRESLGYNEVFWHEISRLSLGIGTSDHPIIGEAMQQVGSHPVLKRTLEGILGPDPAILEISTLTSLNGAADQGIHTDSDWFGSSLLYSRSFLHSYSLFIALQDTSKELGATTVCPGTHYCADPDLEELCLEHGAFEVSTNGFTGDHGLLRKGDAFMFNQNVWHRGPRNQSGRDRIMLIMTFATAKDVAADRRRQGLGTYYYQRFNMWGSTFSMLKDATTKMVQPLAVLRALGLVKTRGITWIHQFCQQFANGDEFYNDDELDGLYTQVLDYYKVPRFLLSKSERWETFIPETMALWIDFVAFVNAVAITVYCILVAVICAIRGPGTSEMGRVYRRPIIIAATIGVITYSVSSVFDRTDLARSVATGDVFTKPFPSESERQPSFEPRGPSTFPERHDVLISTRFDADFLASYNRFLNFHPGNRRWDSMVSSFASLPDHLYDRAAEIIVQETLNAKEDGLATRFLLQDPVDGSWTIMTEAEAQRTTKRALVGRSKPLTGVMVTQVKYLLSDSRFGVHRGTSMASLSQRWLGGHWLPLLLGEEAAINVGSKEDPKHALKICHAFVSIETLGKATEKRFATSIGSLRRSPLRPMESVTSPEDGEVDVGDRVWVFFEGDGQWYEGRVVDFLNEETCKVYFYNGGYVEPVHVDDIRPYFLVKEGDKVLVDYYGNFEEYYPGTVTNVHPDGRCSIQYSDGEKADKINRENILLRQH